MKNHLKNQEAIRSLDSAGKCCIFLSFCTIMNMYNNIPSSVSLAAAFVSVIENVVGSFSSQRCTELLSVGASETWPFPVLLPFDPSRHKLLPLYWATEEGFELGLPLSDLSIQSLLLGGTAGSLLLSWIKRNRGNREAFSALQNICETVVHHTEQEERDLILNTGAEQLHRVSQLIAVLITCQHDSSISHSGLQQYHFGFQWKQYQSDIKALEYR